MPGVYLDRWPSLWGSGKPGPEHQLDLERSGPLATGLQLLCLFDSAAEGYADLANDARTFTHTGTIHTEDGAFGGQVWSEQTAASGAGFSPFSALYPSITPTDNYTISAFVHFDGTNPLPGAYASNGASLCADGAGRLPLQSWSGTGSGIDHAFQASDGTAYGAFTAVGGAMLSPSALTGWHRVTVVASASAGTTSLWVDGGATWFGSTTFRIVGFSLSLLLGSGSAANNPGRNWPWPTADLFFWGRALTAAEVSGHAIAPWRSTLRPRYRAGWQGLPGVSVAPPPTGPTLAGVGRVTADAGVPSSTIKNGSATLAGGSLMQAHDRQRLVARTSLAGASTVFGDAAPLSRNRTAEAYPAGAGAVSATARAVLMATATLAGSGSATATPSQKALGFAAFFGAAGGMLPDANLLQTGPIKTASANIGGSGGVTATAITKRAASASFGGSGTGTFTPSFGTQHVPAGGVILAGEGFATPYVVKPAAPSVRPGIAPTTLPSFFAVEIETYIPGWAAVNATQAHGTRAHGTLSQQTQGSPELTAIIRASDMGYRSSQSDVGGIAVYPPVLDQAFQINAMLNLEPNRSSASAAWGMMLLINLHNGWLDTIVGTQSCDGRPLKVLRGIKQWDAARQYMTDPPSNSLTTAFIGLGTAWSMAENELQIPLRDATYYLENLMPMTTYGGNGRLDGTPSLKNRMMPYCRGGFMGSWPIRNVTPVLVDPVCPGGPVFQYNNGPGTVERLYEGGFSDAMSPGKGITSAGDISNPALGRADLYTGNTAPGRYVTDNAHGLFQLGSNPVSAITVDVTGWFRSGVAPIHPFSILQYILSEDIGIPSSMLDTDSFTAAMAEPNFGGFVGGLYFDGASQAPTGLDIVNTILSGMSASLVPARNGKLRLLLLRDPLTTTEPILGRLDQHTIISMTPRALPTSLYPPPFRMKVGFNHNYTIQASGLNPNTPIDRQQVLAVADQFSQWSSAEIQRAYRRPNDPGEIITALLNQQSADTIAGILGSLWGMRRRLYDISVPISRFDFDMGDVVQVVYPIEDLDDEGKTGRVVGYSLRSIDAAVTYSVLV